MLEAIFGRPLSLSRRVLAQDQRQRGPKVYSLHAPEVECIGKGKAHRPYNGVKGGGVPRPSPSWVISRQNTGWDATISLIGPAMPLLKWLQFLLCRIYMVKKKHQPTFNWLENRKVHGRLAS